MKVIVSRPRLADALKSVLPAVARRATLPILAGVRIDVTGRGLVLAATDLEAAARCHIRDGVTAEQTGSTVVAAKPLAKALASMPADEIAVESTESAGRAQVILRAGARVLTLDAHPTADWPSLPNTDEIEPAGSAQATGLAEALTRAAICASDDEARPVLTCVALLFKAGSTTLTVVATDSYRLGVLEVPLTEPARETQTLLVPARVVKEIAKRMKRVRGDATVGTIAGEHGSRLVAFGFDSAVWTVRTVEGEFPNWQQIMPDGSGAAVTFDTGELTSVLKTAAAVRTNGTPVRLHLDECCTLSLVEQDAATISETLSEASFSPDGVGGLDVAFNPDFLADALRFLDTDRVEMRVRDGLKPALLGSAERRYVLMPVRIS